MSPHILHRLGTAVPLVPLLLLAARPAMERASVGGTFTMTYTQRHPLPIPDAEGHALVAAEAKGTNRSTGSTSYMDGAEVLSSEIADLVQGSGMHQGYVTLAREGGEHVSKWSGRVSTTLDASRRPVTSFEGTWTKVKGPSGHGTYKGRLTGPSSYTVEWQGELELGPRAAR
jgi:hypothetical protein